MPDTLRILVKACGTHRDIALLQECRLTEYYTEDVAEGTLVNAVLLGRVENVVPGIKAAFVQIGQPLNGFLPLNEMPSFRQAEGDKTPTSGAEIIVQVKKDPKDQKGAFLTRDISLPGQYLIYMPLNRYVGVSKRVAELQERETLLAMGRELGAEAEFGLIMRYAALYARKEELLAELTALRTRWTEIQSKATYQKAPATLYRDPSALTSLVRDYAPRYQLTITCNDAVNRMPAPSTGLLWEQVSETEMEAAWRAARIPEQLAEALSRKVTLKNGGSLVIDEREALSTVDVNSGRYIGDQDGELALKLNLAACEEIAHQIRLRNLCGILLIDFIDMKTDAARDAVKEKLKASLSRERDKTVLHGYTSLGLLEMTRKRTGVSLRDALTTPCGACGGTGYRIQPERETTPCETNPNL
jgi:Rne/Rng family ribonuclease